MAMYVIETRERVQEDEWRDGMHDWADDGIGDPNRFATFADAERAIEDLLVLGHEFACVEFRIVEREDEPPPARPRPLEELSASERRRIVEQYDMRHPPRPAGPGQIEEV